MSRKRKKRSTPGIRHDEKARSRIKYLMANEEKLFRQVIAKRRINEHIFFLFLLETGIRLNEAEKLLVKDVLGPNGLNPSFFSHTSKNGWPKKREIPISEILSEALVVYFEWRGPIEPNQSLFVSSKNKTINRFYLQCLCKKMMTAIGRPDCSIHSLRHTFAKRLMRKGVGLTIIKELMGHRYISTTEIYTEPGREELFDALRSSVN